MPCPDQRELRGGSLRVLDPRNGQLFQSPQNVGVLVAIDKTPAAGRGRGGTRGGAVILATMPSPAPPTSVRTLQKPAQSLWGRF